MPLSPEPKLILVGFSPEDSVVIDGSFNLWEEPAAQNAMAILTGEITYVSKSGVSDIFNSESGDVVIYKTDINNALASVSNALKRAFPSS